MQPARQPNHSAKPERRVHAFVFAVLALCLQWGVTTPALAQRVALLIGNASYQIAPLRNPPNDVREMEAALTAIGFKVQKVLNANQNQMKRAVRDFGTLAQGAEVAFLYYSGHGTQSGGENYLLPVGATIDKEADYEVEAVSANALMRQIAGARPRAAVVVLDACRDNPYASATKGGTKGLSRMDAPTGTMIAFATSPNNTASDEGHYARALAARLRTPGAELIDVFRDTTADVRRLSGGKQEPRISEMSISERIYLAGPPAAARPVQPVPPVQVASLNAEPVVRTMDQAAPTLTHLDRPADSRVYIVRPGDTVVRIALDAGLNHQDIVRWNNMKSASDLYVGQVLRLTPPANETPGTARTEGGSDVSFIWPTRGLDESVIGFDEVRKGIDISGVEGAAVLASADGRVVYSGNGLRGYGNLIIIKHNASLLTAYAHNKTVLVSLDQQVKQGQQIAEMGQSESDRVKLHFELRKAGKSVDPMPFLPVK